MDTKGSSLWLIRGKHFDFKDLMDFGMFILALLTFVFAFR